MKSSHTQPGSVNLDVMESRKTDVPRRLLIEDMSVCEISDEDEQNESNEEILLVENKSCKMCDFEATDEIHLDKHKWTLIKH